MRAKFLIYMLIFFTAGFLVLFNSGCTEEMAKEMEKDIQESIDEAVDEAQEEAKSALAKWWDEQKQAASDKTQEVKDGIADWFNDIGEGIKNSWNDFWGGIFGGDDSDEDGNDTGGTDDEDESEEMPTDFSAMIIWVAQNEWEVGQFFDPVANRCAEGCCKHWASKVVNSAAGRLGCGNSSWGRGTIELGNPISFDQAVAGDILQINYYSYKESPNYDPDPEKIVHTAIVMDYLGNGVFRVINCNWCVPHCNIITIDEINTNSSKYVDPRVYRVYCKD